MREVPIFATWLVHKHTREQRFVVVADNEKLLFNFRTRLPCPTPDRALEDSAWEHLPPAKNDLVVAILIRLLSNHQPDWLPLLPLMVPSD